MGQLEKPRPGDIPSSTTFSDIIKPFDELTGKENAIQLNEIAGKINRYYTGLTLTDLTSDTQTYNLAGIDLGTLDPITTIVDLQRQFREKSLTKDQKDVVASLFGKQDVFEPLIRKINETVKNTSADKLGSLMYLTYQIDNPYHGPSIEAKKITSQAQQNSGISVSETEMDKITQTVDEFVLAATSCKSAWAYFDPFRSKAILELLLSQDYGPKFFRDLVYLAQENSFVLPPQIFSLLTKIQAGEEQADLVENLKEYYDSGKNLADLSKEGGLNFQITGLQRSDEYPSLEEYIPEDLRQGITVSFGGSVGMVEVLRAQRLHQYKGGEIVIIDQSSAEENLSRALVLKNELRYQPGDPRLTAGEIRGIWERSPAPLKFIKAKLPQTPDQIKEYMRQNGVDMTSPVRVIYDQRASALYLKDQQMLDSIRTSISLLNQGGVYFLTRGFADRLFVDLVVSIAKNGQEKITPLLLHHSNSFYAPGVKGLIPANRVFLYTAEGGTRRGTNLEYVRFQQERLSEEIIRQQQLSIIEEIGEIFYERFFRLISNEEGMSFSHLLVYAYAASRNLPLYIYPNIPIEFVPYYEQVMNKLVDLMKIYNQEQKIGITDFSLPDPPEGFIFTARAMKSFFAKVIKDLTILDKPVAYLKDQFDKALLPEVIPHLLLVEASLGGEPLEEKKLDANQLFFEAQFRKNLKKQFKVHFSYVDISYEGVIADALLTSRGFPIRALRQEHITNIPELKSEYYIILREINKKIQLTRLGRIYKMNFSKLTTGKFEREISLLSKVTDDTWREVVNFEDQYQDVRTFQAV